MIGEEESFPEKAIKLIDGFPGGMFPQVCSVRTCVRTRNAILGRGTSTIRKNGGSESTFTCRLGLLAASTWTHQRTERAAMEAELIWSHLLNDVNKKRGGKKT